ncbi:prophage baseplate assembly protein v [hydrocarbon metagenome]|uniref:Prophage baseplate assembly protein v n=1 Tax=hydrocarbon metagenome TaxID=938273 RepID=A0A0W8FUT7_9ZZZZ
MMIRGIINSVTEGLIKLFSADGRTDESFEDREYFQHYGFTSRPKEGAEIIIIREGNHIIGIASDDRLYRIAIEDGEVALYTDEGDKIHFKRDKIIEVVSGNKLIATVENEVDITTKVAKVTASESCEVESPSITLGTSGTKYALIDERLITIYNAHVHGEDGTPTVKLTTATVATEATKAN